MIVSERVRERMEGRGLSQSELARRVGVAQPTIYKLIRTAKKGSTKLHLIARELGTTPAYLTGETDDPNEDAPAEPDLSHDERQLIDSYAALDPAQRAALLTIAKSMAKGRGDSGTVHEARMRYEAGEQA